MISSNIAEYKFYLKCQFIIIIISCKFSIDNICFPSPKNGACRFIKHWLWKIFQASSRKKNPTKETPQFQCIYIIFICTVLFRRGHSLIFFTVMWTGAKLPNGKT